MSQVIQNRKSTRNFLKNTLKDDLLQFVLLFAAVTLGFFAENLREENAQRKLEIKLMHERVAEL
jgi:nitrate reductase gamma subunit